jgi:hypothetical protein
MRNFLIIFIFFVCIFDVNASFVASNNAKINVDLPTHVMVAGNPDKLGNLFIYSLLTRAKIYLEKSPNEQILIIGRNEDREAISNAGFFIINKKAGLMKPNSIKDAIREIKKISSIDIYAHSNALSGASLDSNSWVTQLLNEKDDLWDDVLLKINNSSFIFIHGCNAGIKFAPLLAKKLKIAVFSALTSTDFQYIYDNLFWSFDYNAEANVLSKKNLFNYSAVKSCGAYCTRMKPDNSSYKGHWGNWSAGGYPSFKLFCGSNNNINCEEGALEGIYTFPGTFKYADIKSSPEIFKKQLVDFMCPFASSIEKQATCQENLDKSLDDKTLATYSPFRGTTLVCDREICKAHFVCSGLNAAFNPGACVLESETTEQSTSFTDEYAFLINIFKKNFKSK